MEVARITFTELLTRLYCMVIQFKYSFKEFGIVFKLSIRLKIEILTMQI